MLPPTLAELRKQLSGFTLCACVTDERRQFIRGAYTCNSSTFSNNCSQLLCGEASSRFSSWKAPLLITSQPNSITCHPFSVNNAIPFQLAPFRPGAGSRGWPWAWRWGAEWGVRWASLTAHGEVAVPFHGPSGLRVAVTSWRPRQAVRRRGSAWAALGGCPRASSDLGGECHCGPGSAPLRRDSRNALRACSPGSSASQRWTLTPSPAADPPPYPSPRGRPFTSLLLGSCTRSRNCASTRAWSQGRRCQSRLLSDTRDIQIEIFWRLTLIPYALGRITRRAHPPPTRVPCPTARRPRTSGLRSPLRP